MLQCRSLVSYGGKVHSGHGHGMFLAVGLLCCALFCSDWVAVL